MPLEDENAYWRQAYGIAGQWARTRRNRTGCLVLLLGALILIGLILIAGLFMAVS